MNKPQPARDPLWLDHVSHLGRDLGTPRALIWMAISFLFHVMPRKDSAGPAPPPNPIPNWRALRAQPDA